MRRTRRTWKRREEKRRGQKRKREGKREGKRKEERKKGFKISKETVQEKRRAPIEQGGGEYNIYI